MMTWEEWIDLAADYLQDKWGISKQFSRSAANLFGYLWYYGLNPEITSGYRSQKKQKELMDRYMKGDPSVVYPPSTTSKHLTGDAIDIKTNNSSMAFQIAAALGIKTVSGDPVHFQRS